MKVRSVMGERQTNGWEERVKRRCNAVRETNEVQGNGKEVQLFAWSGVAWKIRRLYWFQKLYFIKSRALNFHWSSRVLMRVRVTVCWKNSRHC